MNEPRTSPSADLPADNRRALRGVIRACRKAALATLMLEEGGVADRGAPPYASLVSVVVDHDLAPVILLSGISDHTRNIMADPRVSLLFDGSDGCANPQTGPRVTLMGVAERSTDTRLHQRFLAHHPGAAQYAGFGDFGFWRVRPQRVHFVGGFGRAVWFDTPFGIAPESAQALADSEAGILNHMNSDHPDAVDLLARGQIPGWRMVGIDPDGCDFSLNGEHFSRLSFESPIDGPVAARTVLADLAHRARG
jgi:heme iron utilization protein